MDPKLIAIPILALVISLSTIGLVNAQTSDTTGTTPDTTTAPPPDTTTAPPPDTTTAPPDTTTAPPDTTTAPPPGQTSSSCTKDQILAAKQGLADIQKKIADLRMQLYNDWKTAHDAGQYTGTFEQYSKEKFANSADATQIKSDYQKYNSILRSCHTGGPMKQNAPSNTSCSQSDITNARQELATAQKQLMDLKDKAYQQFQQDQASGQYTGTWEQYAKDKFYNLPELAQLKATHDKYTSFMKSCFGNQVPHKRSMQQNPNGNNMPTSPPNNDNSNYNSNPSDWNQNMGSDFGLTGNSNFMPPTDQTLNPVPQISNPTDALGALSSHNIPGWVKGVAGWWAQGKISDDDFVSAIKFLVNQGIIKI